MYLRQSTKWNKFLLAEAIENVGLPSRVVTFIRRKAAATVHSDAHAQKLSDQQGIELQKIDEKHLTWLGQLLKKFDFKLYDVGDARELAHFIKKAVRETSGIDTSSSEEEREALGERIVDAIGPVIDYAMDISGPAPEQLQTLADMKALRKRMTRALKRAELPEGEITTAQGIFDRSIISNFENSDDLQLRLRRIMIVLALDPAYYEEELKKADDLRKAYGLAQIFLDSPKKKEDNVIHEFDNGYYWYDIQSHACDFEGKQMGHCGRGEQGSLVSLRAGGGRQMKPFVTLEFDGTTLYQIKGKGNTAPKKDLWPYVDWFIENMGVERIAETGQHSSDHEAFDEMLEYFDEKHPDIKLRNSWVKDATKLLEEASIEEDSQTTVEIDWPGGPDDVQEVGVVLNHQAYWPVKDVIVDEDTHRLLWEIRHDAQSIADDTLYPNPRITASNIFARGVQDSQAAMIRIEMVWGDAFEPSYDDEQTIKEEAERLEAYLAEIVEIAEHLTSPNAAPEEAEFDYNGFFEGVMKKLEAYGVYRDIAGEIDAEDERGKSDQMDLPLAETKRTEPDWFDQQILDREQRIIQRWSQIIK
jgi:hypothetical protein